MASSSSTFAYSNALLPSHPFYLLHLPSLNVPPAESARISNDISDDVSSASTTSALSSLQDAFQNLCQAFIAAFSSQVQTQTQINLSPPTSDDMYPNSAAQIPGTPGVIAPTPETSSVETSTKSNGYFSRRPAAGPDPGERARTLDRIADTALRRRRTSQLASPGDALQDETESKSPPTELGSEDGYLAPANAATPASKSSRHTFSRSPSPLGLIPIHRDWRRFVRSLFHSDTCLLLSLQPSLTVLLMTDT